MNHTHLFEAHPAPPAWSVFFKLRPGGTCGFKEDYWCFATCWDEDGSSLFHPIENLNKHERILCAGLAAYEFSRKMKSLRVKAAALISFGAKSNLEAQELREAAVCSEAWERWGGLNFFMQQKTAVIESEKTYTCRNCKRTFDHSSAMLAGTDTLCCDCY